MRFHVLLLLIASCLYAAMALGSYNDCCLKYVKKLSHRTQKMAVAYRRQETDGSCNIPAIIFTMRRGRKLCADPREDWVNDLTQLVDVRMRKLARRGAKRG